MITFNDPYLKKDATASRQSQATEQVNQMGTYPTFWRERLIELKTYIIICQECMAAEGDVYEVKLKAYRTEFSNALVSANAAQAEANPENPNTGGNDMYAPIGRS